MGTVGIAGVIFIITNVLVSYQGLKSATYLQEYAFDVDEILIGKDYKRLFTSGFLHVSWAHLLFNMIALYNFSDSIESFLGIGSFLVVYFGSLLGGNLLALYIHRQHGDYTAVGASGAISGVILGAVALYPGMEIGFFGLGFQIPAWLYAFLYVLFSIYGIKSRAGNIGHEAHLGGGITGVILVICIWPYALQTNYLPVILMLVPTAVFMYLLVKRPEFLLLDNAYSKSGSNLLFEDKHNASKTLRQKELDYLLDKIAAKGLNGLTDKEKKRLEELSR